MRMPSFLTSRLDRLRGDKASAVLAKGAVGSFGLNVGWAGLGFASHVLLARMMGKEDYGDYAYAFTWLMVLLFPATLGLDKTALRFVAVYRAKDELSLLRGFLRFSHRVVLAASLAIGLTQAGIAYYLGDRISPGLCYTLWASAVALPVLALATLRQGVVQATKHPVQAQAGLMVLRPACVIVLAGAAWYAMGRTLTGYQGMFVYAGVVSLVLVLNTFFYRRRFADEQRHGQCSQDTAAWLHMTLPMVLMAATTMLLRQGAILIIGAQQDTAAAGVYSAATRLVDLVVFGLLAVNMIAAPMFAELYAQGKRRELQRVLATAAVGICVLSLPVAAFLGLCGRFMLGLFGEGYAEAYPVLLVLLCGQTFKALAGPVGYLMTMTGHQKQAAVIVVICTALNLALCWLLIPHWGLVGAAGATAVSTVLWNVLLLALVARYLGVNPTVFNPKILGALRGRGTSA
jgi:O-antigen/teichoic acid export membrane protein